MKIKDLKGILYNQHGCPFQMTVLWNFNDDKVEEYASGVHEYIIDKYPEKEVKRIQAEIISGAAVIVIQTN
jgi:hypothetical protein